MAIVKGAEFEFSSWLNYDNPEEVVIVDPFDGTPVIDALPDQYLNVTKKV